MSVTEQNKAVVRRLTEEVYNRGNVDVLDELLSPNTVDHDPTTGEAPIEGHEAIEGHKEGIAWLRSASTLKRSASLS